MSTTPAYYKQCSEHYEAQTAKLQGVVARIVEAGQEIQEWWSIDTKRRLPGAPRDQLRSVDDWFGLGEFGEVLHGWDQSRGIVTAAWNQLEDRDDAEAPWDPFA